MNRWELPYHYGPFGTGLFFDVIHGNADIKGLGVYFAKPGWDYCTGLGAPRLAAYLAKLNTL